MRINKPDIKLVFSASEKILFLLFFVFSSFLMWKTFSVSELGNLQIASKAWSDFAATIPLIRSFSLGSNFPPEYPIFSGPNIRYHFAFYALVGMLERFGIPIDYALNTLSSIGFTFLLISIYVFASRVFQNRTVGILSTIFFLFNGSFSFLEFFKVHPPSLGVFFDILKNTSFSSFGPYDGKIVSAFWSLNIFTNQRHLSFGYATLISIIFLLNYYANNPRLIGFKKVIVFGFLIGILPFIHLPVFGMAGLVLILSLIIYPNIRKHVFAVGIISFVVAVPQLIFMGRSSLEIEIFNPGYLLSDRTIAGFFEYWFLNMGITTVLAPLGFILANKSQRKIGVFFILFFVVGNLFQFSPEIAANHKFFNISLIGINIFSSYFLVLIWKNGLIGKILSIFYILLMTLSGVIDLPPIFNDYKIQIEDIPTNKTALFIFNNTEKNAVFLNSTYLYDPASIAGRKIYMGWPYFSWSAGYDTTKREEDLNSVLLNYNKKNLCNFFRKEHIDYLEVQNGLVFGEKKISKSYFDSNFTKVFDNKSLDVQIYDLNMSCNTFLK